MGFHKRIHTLYSILGRFASLRQNVPVVSSGEPLGVSIVLDTQQGPHKYPLNE